MASTITTSSTTITPDAVDGFESQRAAGTLVHPILGSSSPDITLRPARLRSGTLRLVFLSETAAKAAEDALSAAAVFTLTTDRTTLPSTLVITDRITRALDDATRAAWIVTVGYQEVTT
ncbi:MAG: hypothetical protein J0H96_01300 [Microbacterium ginsengisoli]|nr:hypothetical protein [Microbacterium ginsengisoli]